jgi:hypothetical protein
MKRRDEEDKGGHAADRRRLFEESRGLTPPEGLDLDEEQPDQGPEAPPKDDEEERP